MGKTSKRSFDIFLETEGKEGIRCICKEYATGGNESTWSKLSDKYNITRYGLDKLRDVAISEAIIPPGVAIAMAQKGCGNQTQHAKEVLAKDGVENISYSSSSSYAHYMDLFKRRREFIQQMDESQKYGIAKYYINSVGSNQKIADYLGLTVREMLRILRDSIIYDIVSDGEMYILNDCLLRRASSSPEKVKKVLFDCWCQRQKRIIDSLEVAAAAEQFRLETEADFLSSDEEEELWQLKEEDS